MVCINLIISGISIQQSCRQQNSEIETRIKIYYLYDELVRGVPEVLPDPFISFALDGVCFVSPLWRNNLIRRFFYTYVLCKEPGE